METFDLYHSGNHRDFGTGAVRDTDVGKPRPDALSPFALHRFAVWMEKGFREYGEWNWENGIPVTQLVASLQRHINAYTRGLRDEDHLSAALFNIQCILHFEELAKLGNPTALDMLDRYASKQLHDDLIYETEAMIEADSFDIQGDDELVVHVTWSNGVATPAYAEWNISDYLPTLPVKVNPDWIEKQVRVIRDIAVNEYTDDRDNDSIYLRAGYFLDYLRKRYESWKFVGFEEEK